jgi:hypothetical protein
MRVATLLPQNPCVSHIPKTAQKRIMHCSLFALVPGPELQIACNKPLSRKKPTFFVIARQPGQDANHLQLALVKRKFHFFSSLPRKQAPCQPCHEKKIIFYSALGTLFFSKKTKKKLVSASECAIFEAWKTITTQTDSTESPFFICAT